MTRTSAALRLGGIALCLGLLACGAPQLTLDGTCAAASPCVVAEDATVFLVPRVDGEAPERVVVTSDGPAVVVRTADPQQIVLAGASPGVAVVTVTVDGAAARVLRLEVRAVADLGVAIRAPITADVTHSFPIAPRDASGQTLAWDAFARPGEVPMLCVRGQCRVTLPEGSHTLWNGAASAPVQVQVARGP